MGASDYGTGCVGASVRQYDGETVGRWDGKQDWGAETLDPVSSFRILNFEFVSDFGFRICTVLLDHRSHGPVVFLTTDPRLRMDHSDVQRIEQIIQMSYPSRMSEQELTVNAIEARFQNEWVLVGDPETTETLEVVKGKVLHHSRDRDEVYRKAVELRPKRYAVLFTGEMPVDTAIVL